MLNYALIGTQMARDYAVNSADHYNRNYQSFQNQGPYHPLSEFDQQWDSQETTNPATYEAAVKLLDNRSEWLKGLSEAQKQAALSIAPAADPKRPWNSKLLGQ